MCHQEIPGHAVKHTFLPVHHAICQKSKEEKRSQKNSNYQHYPEGYALHPFIDHAELKIKSTTTC
jgi:hypothetical protein